MNLPCPHCGADVKPSDLYCPNCTKSLRLNRQEVLVPSHPSPARPILWVVLIGLLGFAALVAFPFLVAPQVMRNATSPPAPLPGPTCMSKIKQLSLCATLYMADHDDRMFPVITFSPLLMPYVKDASVMACPETNVAYAVNSNLLQLKAKQVADPARTVFFYEGSGQSLSTQHDGGSNVAFFDNSARFVAPTAATSLKWKAK